MKTPLSHKNCPSLWLALPSQLRTLKRPPALCSSKFHTVLTCSPYADLTLPSFPQHINRHFKVYLFHKSDLQLDKTKINPQPLTHTVVYKVWFFNANYPTIVLLILQIIF